MSKVVDFRIFSYACGTCGTAVLVVRSIAGGPWEVECGNGHPWIRSGGDVVITVDTDA